SKSPTVSRSTAIPVIPTPRRFSPLSRSPTRRSNRSGGLSPSPARSPRRSTPPRAAASIPVARSPSCRPPAPTRSRRWKRRHATTGPPASSPRKSRSPSSSSSGGAPMIARGRRRSFQHRVLDWYAAHRPGGSVPDTLDELRSLPGIGRYTAGAVMSFAHHQDAPVLDTNVARLLRRHFGVAATPRARTEELWSLAAAVIQKGKGYLINQ